MVASLPYYDAAFFAKRIKAEAYLTTGLMDNTCSPTSVLCAYNNIPGQTADPDYTRQTEEAIRVLQTTAGLPVTGYTDKDTWDAVVRLYAQTTGGRL